LWFFPGRLGGGGGALSDWCETIVPHILRECVPRADGKWWITHSLEIES
jgi:hypothetical protein